MVEIGKFVRYHRNGPFSSAVVLSDWLSGGRHETTEKIKKLLLTNQIFKVAFHASVLSDKEKGERYCYGYLK